jgi:hypothetical protein
MNLFAGPAKRTGIMQESKLCPKLCWECQAAMSEFYFLDIKTESRPKLSTEF